jgi:hypothetical protein
MAIDEQQVEGKHHQPVRLSIDGRSQGCEIGNTVAVLNDDLAIHECRSAAELAAGLDHPMILVAPVEAAAGEGSGVLARHADERAEAVVLDLVNPAAACWRLGRKYRKLWRNARG